ncbi:MAG: TadE/TadG family type IV pilus assembly protein [Candidatus Sulfotelmatobacter sp.]
MTRRCRRAILLCAVGGTHGSEIAEFAMILPLFFMIFMAIFWFGQAYRIYGTMTQATRTGAEAAVAPVCATCAAGGTPAQNAQTAVYSALAAAHLSKNQLVPYGAKWTAPALCACGSASSSCAPAAACDNTVTDMCVQTNVQLSYTAVGGMGTCGTSVSARYQYPYDFWIPCYPQPCMSLDLGNVLLPGQAQMRGETQ